MLPAVGDAEHGGEHGVFAFHDDIDGDADKDFWCDIHDFAKRFIDAGEDDAWSMRAGELPEPFDASLVHWIVRCLHGFCFGFWVGASCGDAATLLRVRNGT